jgi:hypothetical protein
MVTTLAIPNLKLANVGDSALGNPDRIFAAIPTDTGYISSGNNRSLGTGYPPALTVTDTTTSDRDKLYPIISSKKIYGSLAQSGVGLNVSSYPNFNLLKYPQINFGYAKPGDDFVAKRNWWAFSVDVGGNDASVTNLARKKRNFVLSVYEIPSQLAISAASFMSLGQYASGAAWSNVNIDGGMFVGRMLGGVGTLVHQGDQGAARDQVVEHVGQHRVVHQLCHAHMKIAQQLGAGADIVLGDCGTFLGHVFLQAGQPFGLEFAHKGSGHFGLQHAPHRKHLARFAHRWGGDKGAARRFHLDQALLRQLKQGLAHQGARHAVVVGQLLLGELGTRLQAVLDDGAGQAFDNLIGGCGGFGHGGIKSPFGGLKNCIHFCL